MLEGFRDTVTRALDVSERALGDLEFQRDKADGGGLKDGHCGDMGVIELGFGPCVSASLGVEDGDSGKCGRWGVWCVGWSDLEGVCLEGTRFRDSEIDLGGCCIPSEGELEGERALCVVGVSADGEGERAGLVVGEHQKGALGCEGKGRGDLGASGDFATDGVCSQMAEYPRKRQRMLRDLEGESRIERCIVGGLFAGMDVSEWVKARRVGGCEPIDGGDRCIWGDGELEASEEGLVFGEFALEVDVCTV